MTVGYMSGQHVIHNWNWLNRLARNKESIQLNIVDLGIGAEQIGEIIAQCKLSNDNVICVGVHRRGSGSSERHSIALNQVLSGITADSSDINILSDADCYTVAKDWDLLVRKVLSSSDCIGTTYENIGGFSSGSGKKQTYKRLPNCTWFAMAPGFKWNQLDCTPDLHNESRLSKEDAAMYNLPSDNVLLRDAGWKIPRFIKDNGLKYTVLTHEKPSQNSKVLAGLSDYHEEYQLGGVPVLVHQRGASKHAFRVGKLSEGFLKAADKWLEKVEKREATIDDITFVSKTIE